MTYKLDDLIGKITCADCMDVLADIPDKSIDMICCDLPYGCTNCKWDIPLPLDKLWGYYERIIKDNGCIVLFGQEPFASIIRTSNLPLYRYDYYWVKERLCNVLNVKQMPGKTVETISVFYKKQPTYNPQMQPRAGREIKPNRPKAGKVGKLICASNLTPKPYQDNGLRYPTQVLKFKRDILTSNLHPTQKPVALIEFLVKTYTNANDVVLDNCSGSGTTAVACNNLKRRFICIEKDPEYAEKSRERLKRAQRQINLF